MLISYDWLRELVATSLDARSLAERLTMVGLTVDTVHEAGDDYILEIDLTSNRPDCLSHLGVAREVAVIERSAVRPPETKAFARAGQAGDFTSVEIADATLCSRYAARVVRGVRIAPSPPWLADRLVKLGSRPLNNVTDVTNYVLHELGQPLHAFDFAKLSERRIIVRRARAGEGIRTLDETERELDEQMLVIADADCAVAIAGVMGGADSAISDSTNDVLIESAHFDSASVRRTARILNLHTDASHRFERGVDSEGVLRAQERAVNLICELAGGTATEDAVDVYPQPRTSATVNLRLGRLAEVLGMSVAEDEARRILTNLGFAADESNDLQSRYTAPSWRVDIEREEDLIEEVGRHAGYDRIPSALPPVALGGDYLPNELRRRAVRRALVHAGFSEAINFSFVPSAHDETFELAAGQTEDSSFISLPNPIIEDLTRMRLSLLPGLLSAVKHNFNHGTRDVRLFEIGNVFRLEQDGERPHETEMIALVSTGGSLEADRAGTRRELDFYDLKGAVEAMAEEMRIAPLGFAPADVRHLRRGAAARVLLGGEQIGTVGRLADEIAAAYKFRQPVYVCELRFDLFLAAEEVRARYRPLARYPAIMRDATVLVSRRRTLDELRRAIESQGATALRDIKFVDVYEGERVPTGMRSVTLRFEYRLDDRTLRDEEVDEAHAGVVSLLEAQAQ